ncbi:glycerol-3-phosphate dehydrogenase [Clavulina sp. PMI_390]|nr:glycerol-3-phosphate dehydrogenase [Clavulina sp. PMI_390]
MSISGLTNQNPRKVLVLGAGNFGSCLADHLADSEHEVLVWSKTASVVQSLNETHKHSQYLTDHVFPTNMVAVGPELPSKEVIQSVSVIIFAIPTQGLRKLLEEIRPSLDDSKLPLMIFVNKGIEIDTGSLTLEIIYDTCGKEIATQATFLSGPSFAKEIIRRQPTQVSVVSLSLAHAQEASAVFHQPWFRCYAGGDPIGVEIAGAMKNVYAIASGAAAGMGYENNTRAGLITRSLAEMTRIGVSYGGNPLTFLSLAGVGDLFLTCNSPTSRNYTVGYRMGQGESLEEIVRTLGSVAEGVTTTKALYEIVKKMKINAPIAIAVYKVLYEGQSVAEMAKGLMSRPLAEDELGLPEQAAAVSSLLTKLGLN